MRAEAKKRGLKVLVEPDWGIVVQLEVPRGKRYLRYSSLDVNTQAAAEIAKDKDYANFFMKKMGYPTVSGKAFYSPLWAKTIGSKQSSKAAYVYARTLGFPVFVKPNSGSQGRSTALVRTKQEFDRALTDVFLHDRVALVQKPVAGRDYRIVVFNGKFVCAYERRPFSVIGDGKSSLRSLIKAAIQGHKKTERLTIDIHDPRIRECLSRGGYTLRSVPPKGTEVLVLNIANLSSGGTGVDVTDTVHPAWKKLAVALARDMNLTLAGIDVLSIDDLSTVPKRFRILEINASPGLDHYAALGKKTRERTRALYADILTYLSK